MYKKLPHAYQLLANKTTSVREIIAPFHYQLTYKFISLSEMESLPLNSIIG